jgi:hypothetical protein
MSDFMDLTRPLVQAIFSREELLAGDFPRIRFKNGLFADEQLVIIDGAITTVERFAEWEESIAHLMDTGIIMRYGEEIGTKEDLEFLES